MIPQMTVEAALLTHELSMAFSHEAFAVGGSWGSFSTFNHAPNGQVGLVFTAVF